MTSVVALALLGNERFRISRPGTPAGQPGIWIGAAAAIAAFGIIVAQRLPYT